MDASGKGSPGFWVVCAGAKNRGGPLTMDLPGLGEALAVFSFEEEALFYLRLRGEDDGLLAKRVSAPGLLALLAGRWSGFGSVALDPVPPLDAGTLLPLTTTSRDRFVRFLARVEGGSVRALSHAVL